MHSLKWTQSNRYFYDANKPTRIESQKLEIWPGLVTSVDHFDGGLQLQCDCSFRVLRCDTGK